MVNNKKSREEIVQELETARKKIVVGGYYAHYKHSSVKAYRVVDVGIFENTEEVCVIYETLDGDIKWIRKVEDFTAEIEVNGLKVTRFSLME